MGDLWIILLTVELINSDEESKLSYVCCLPPETTAVLERWFKALVMISISELSEIAMQNLHCVSV